MSDVSQGAGWWQATDGRWYPPETHPEYHAPQPDPSAMGPTRHVLSSDLTLRPSPLDREAALGLLAELQEVERSLWAVRDELRRLLEHGGIS